MTSLSTKFFKKK
jgi:hypothetical protein